MSLRSAAVCGTWFSRGMQVSVMTAALCAAACPPAGAQERMKAPGAPCQTAGSTNLTTQCFIAYARRADKQLYAIFRLLRRQLRPEEYAKVSVAEQHWYQFRSSNCDAEEALYTQASTASLAYAACLEADTRQRVEELKTMYAWLFERNSDPFGTVQ